MRAILLKVFFFFLNPQHGIVNTRPSAPSFFSSTLYHVIAVLPLEEVKYFYALFDPDFGHVTCFTQWNVRYAAYTRI